MNRFPLSDDAIVALTALALVDDRRFVFDADVKVRRGIGERVSLFAPSKRKAHHDKLAIKAARVDGIKPTVPSERGMKSAGLRHDTWQWRD